MKKIIFMVLLSALLCGYVPEKTYTFQSGALIKASQLNQNEDDFFNAITDGGADLNVNSITIVTANSYNYASTQTITKIYGVGSFISSSPTQNTYYITGTLPNINGYISPTASPYIVAIAPVRYPHGSIITNLQASANNLVTSTLYRVDSVGSTVATMASVTANNSTGTISNATIDNDNYTYFIGLTSSGAAQNVYYIKVTGTTTTWGIK